METRKEELAGEPVGRLLFRYSLPSVIGMSFDALYSLVDAIFIGQGVGTIGLGALTITFPVFLIIFGVSICVGVGSASIISRALGAGDEQRANRAAGNSFAVITIFAAVMTALGLLFIRPLLILFGATETVLPYAVDYMSIILLATFFLSFSMSTRNVVRAEGNVRVAMVSVVLGTCTNIILDPIFIFVFGWGIRGAAFATLIATFLSFLYLLKYIRSGKSLLKVKPEQIRVDFGLLPEVLSIGFSSLARLLMASLLNIIINNMVAFYGGDIHLAVISSVYRLQIFAALPVIGIGHGLQPIIGFNYGAGAMNRVREALRKGIFSATAFATAFFVVMMLFPAQLLSLFSSDPGLIREGQPILRLLVLTLPLQGLFRVATALFQSLGKAAPALFSSISGQLLFIPFVLVLPFFFSLWGVWYSFPGSEALAFVAVTIWVSKEMRALRLHTGTEDVQPA
jgi:putative MATE family efflux protein